MAFPRRRQPRTDNSSNNSAQLRQNDGNNDEITTKHSSRSTSLHQIIGRLILCFRTQRTSNSRALGGCICCCLLLLLFILHNASHVSHTKILHKSTFPRSFGYYFDSTGRILGAERLHPIIRTSRIKSNRTTVERSPYITQRSKHYRKHRADPFITKDCIQQHDWQVTSFPACNTIHEFDLTRLASRNYRIINYGFHRDVWIVSDHYDGTKLAFKNQRYEHQYTDRNYDRHNRDALAMERLTKSPYVVDIYGFCACAGFSEYSPGGDIANALWHSEGGGLTKSDKLRIASHVALGIADVHTVDDENRASIAHTDITLSQFILIDGVFKLNDFNRCRFMRWNVKKNRPCGFFVRKNRGKFRAPEEYEYEEEDEKVDVYSMGNIFYVLLTERWPFHGVDMIDASEKVMKGERPFLNRNITQSTDPVDMALVQAMNLCLVHDPNERATARNVSNYLIAELRKIVNE